MNTQIDTSIERETVSALMDGQLRGHDLSAALRGMEQADARQSWLLYHLVGDVLRSSDLAHGGHDLAFAERVRQRLGEQVPSAQPSVTKMPIVAPDVRQEAANDDVFRWKLVAGLASLAAVAAIGWGMWSDIGPVSTGSRLAQAPDATVVASAVPPGAVASMTVPAPADGEQVMLRDPRLDELLAAHRAATGPSALGSTAGFLRNATFQGEGR